MRTGLALILAAAAGCGTVEEFLKKADKPTARVKAVRLEDFRLDSFTLRFDVEVSNPYGVGLPLVGMKYALAARETEFLKGDADAQGTVPARGSKVFPLWTAVSIPGLLQVVKGIRPGAVVPYRTDIELAVDAPGVGRLAVPLHKEGELPVPTVPGISLERVRWKSLTLQEATAVLHVGVTNTNDFALGLKAMRYALALGGSDIVSSSVGPSRDLAQGAATTLEIPITLQPVQLGLGVFNLLRGADASYGLKGSLDVTTPFGPLAMPYAASGRVPFLH